MTLMDSLITGSAPSPPKMIVYGQPGIGKTTFAASADAILIDCENGAGAVPGLKRTPYLQSWPQIRRWLVELAQLPAEHGLSAVAIDTIDWLVQRIIEHVVMDLDGKAPNDITNTLGTAHGGYFKAREIVQNVVYRDLLPMLNAVADNGLPVILLAHAANTKITTPEGFDQRLASPDLPHWIAPPFIEWADAVLYAHRDGDERVMLTEGTNVILAKNRYGLPSKLPLAWGAVMQAMTPPEASEAPETPLSESNADLRLVGSDSSNPQE